MVGHSKVCAILVLKTRTGDENLFPVRQTENDQDNAGAEQREKEQEPAAVITHRYRINAFRSGGGLAVSWTRGDLRHLGCGWQSRGDKFVGVGVCGSWIRIFWPI